MFNATSKLILCATIAATLVACNTSHNNNADAATLLINEAQTALNHHKYDDAIALLDTLQARYPKEIDVQRKAMHLRPQAIAGLTIQQIEETDSLLAIATWKADSLSGLFMTVSDKDLIEPYQVAKASTGDLFSRNSIEARLTQTGEFYIISSLNGVSIKHTSVSISSANAEAKTDIVPYDNALNYRSNGSEMITFTASKCDTLGRFAVTHDNNKLTLTFHGNSDYRVSLSATDVHKLADTYRMADAISRKATLSKQLELLRAKLQVARDQDARTSTVDTPDK